MDKKVTNINKRDIKLINIILKPYTPVIIKEKQINLVMEKQMDLYKRLGYITVFDYEEDKTKTLPVPQEPEVKEEVQESRTAIIEEKEKEEVQEPNVNVEEVKTEKSTKTNNKKSTKTNKK